MSGQQAKFVGYGHGRGAGAAGEFAGTDLTVPVPGEWRLHITVRTTDFDASEVTTDIPFT